MFHPFLSPCSVISLFVLVLLTSVDHVYVETDLRLQLMSALCTFLTADGFPTKYPFVLPQPCLILVKPLVQALGSHAVLPCAAEVEDCNVPETIGPPSDFLGSIL